MREGERERGREKDSERERERERARERERESLGIYLSQKLFARAETSCTIRLRLCSFR